MKQKTLRSLTNIAPKALATLFMALSVASCEEQMDNSKMAYITAAEREDYQAYGHIPEGATKNKALGGLIFLGVVGTVLAIHFGTNDNNKKR